MGTFNEFKKVVQTMFAKYGFVETPFSDTELKTLWLIDFDIDNVYTLGCDVASGYNFNECLLNDY